jgi:hypothetical protein
VNDNLTERATAVLMDVMGDESTLNHSRLQIADLFARCHDFGDDEQAVGRAVLAELLDDEDPEVRAHAAHALLAANEPCLHDERRRSDERYDHQERTYHADHAETLAVMHEIRDELHAIRDQLPAPDAPKVG